MTVSSAKDPSDNEYNVYLPSLWMATLTIRLSSSASADSYVHTRTSEQFPTTVPPPEQAYEGMLLCRSSSSTVFR